MDIIKRFNNENNEIDVRIFGTNEHPTFAAKDIAKILDIKDINSTIRDFDNDQKGMHIMHTLGGDQEVAVLTEEGVYRLLFTSRKEIAKRFQKWVFGVIHELRLNGKYEMEQSLIKQKENADKKIKEVETKYQQLNTFITRKHFTARDVIYLAQMHPSRSDDIYKFGRTTDETSRRKNYRGQRAEPIEILETIPVIDRKRAEGNLKYIVEPYLYSNTSEEIVQMPYHLLKLAADAAVYIDKIKLRISNEMKDYIPPHIETSTIEAATDDFIKQAEDSIADYNLDYTDDTYDNVASDDESADTLTPETATPPAELVEQAVGPDPVDVFIEKHIKKSPGKKFTRVKLQARIKKYIPGDLTAITKQILERLGADKRAITITDHELIDTTVAQFITNHCDLNPAYRVDSTALMDKYLELTDDAEAIKVPAQFIATLASLGYNNTKNTDGRFIIGLLPREGSLESFIRAACEPGGETTMDDFVSAYDNYCAAHNLRMYKRPTIKARMDNLGYIPRAYNNGCINFTGICIKK